MADGNETDYDSLEIRPRKPKLTYSRKGQRGAERAQSLAVLASRASASTGQQVTNKGKNNSARPKLNRTTSAAELGKRKRIVEQQSSDGAGGGDEGQSSPPKQKRARSAQPPVDLILDSPAQALPEPSSSAPDVSISHVSSATRPKTSKRKASISRSASTASARRKLSIGAEVSSVVAGSSDEGSNPRAKKKMRRVKSKDVETRAEQVEQPGAEPMDKDGKNTHDGSAKDSGVGGSHDAVVQQSGSSPGRQTSTVPPPTPRHLVLSDKSNLPRPRSTPNRPRERTASPHPPTRTLSASATGSAAEPISGEGGVGAAPRALGRRASAGPRVSRAPSAGQNAIQVYRDGVQEGQAHGGTFNVQALASALPLTSTHPASSPVRPSFASPRRSQSTGGVPQLHRAPQPSPHRHRSRPASSTAAPPVRSSSAHSLAPISFGSKCLTATQSGVFDSNVPPPLPSDGSVILPRTDGDHSSIVLETFESSDVETEDEILLMGVPQERELQEMQVDPDETVREMVQEPKPVEQLGGDDGAELADDESDPVEEQGEDTVKLYETAPIFRDPTLSVSTGAQVENQPEQAEPVPHAAEDGQIPRLSSPFQHPTSPSPQSARVDPAPRSQIDRPPSDASAMAHPGPHSTSSEILVPRVPSIAVHSPQPQAHVDPFVMPPRRPRPALLGPRDSGPLSDEDDLWYAIQTTGTHSSDEDEFEKSEREVGEGMMAGSVRAPKGTRRRVILRPDEVVVVSEEEEDELSIQWSVG